MSEQSSERERFAYYDREADIVWLPTGPPGDIRGERIDRGVVARDVESGKVVSIEIWAASEVLPKAILDLLPTPGDLVD